MRTLFMFILVAGLNTVKAQGNLQFNQVLTLESAVNACTSCWTVPAGKVWKVESYSTNADNMGAFYVNGKELGYVISPAFSTTSVSPRYGTRFPFWLNAGHTLGYSGIGGSKNITFFVIEFNVIP